MAEPLTDDAIDQAILRQAAERLGEWLAESGILEKRVRDLRLHELEQMAMAAIAGHITARSFYQARSEARAGDGSISASTSVPPAASRDEGSVFS